MDQRIQFTPEQQEILSIREGNHFIIAPPGSGKTELLSQWIYQLLEEGETPKEIICLTFTNRAALSMKERIERYQLDSQVLVGNVHHFCSQFLFQNNLISRHKQIIDGEDQKQIIQDILDETDHILYNTGYSFKRLSAGNFIAINSWFKQERLGINEALRNNETKQYLRVKDKKQLVTVCDKYENIKTNYHLLDFDDILNLTYNFLHNRTTEQYKLTNFSWVEVDEVQDINPIQWKIIDYISQGSTRLFFGDPSQSIYSFIGAQSSLFKRKITATQKSDPSSIHTLSVNFRSPSYLQRTFDLYQRENISNDYWKEQTSHQVFSVPPAMALCIRNIPGHHSYYEKCYIIHHILPWYLKQEENKTAILVRTNKEATELDAILNEQDIPYFMVSGTDFFSRREIKDLMALLSISIDPIDYVSWSRILSKDISGLTLKQARRFIKDLQDCGMTPNELSLDPSEVPIVSYYHSIKDDTLIVFDTETTGRDTKENDIIQIAAVKMKDGKNIATFNRYIRTNQALDQTVEIHHITPQYLDKHGEEAEVVLRDFIQFIGEDTKLVAHNAPFDIQMLKNNIDRHIGENIYKEYPIIDTLVMSRKLYPTERSYRLEYLLERFKIEGKNSHNALDDVLATCNLLYFTVDKAKEMIDRQNNFFSLKETLKIRKALQTSFLPRYNAFLKIIRERVSFIQIINGIIGTTQQEKWIQTDLNIQKWLDHIEYFTEGKEYESAYEGMLELVPYYKNCKEVDLYFGKEDLLISTIHKAKGLEFDNVIIPSISSKDFPHPMADRDEKDESARLLYVGITRAKKRLALTFTGRDISPFIGKILPQFNIKSVDIEQIRS
ncbi:UvrD-helicase domain-containing protein [Halosquirtibacter xylanolyticus]|uniref:3'-5' exonuclease n=1 Tax=Halosquirtibacter xylanolyticus TaxID=3374599 RepID=UPI00374A4417|nr:UvrD-helicase domain-containing protein [Prolixibacteraceae bacterium]